MVSTECVAHTCWGSGRVGGGVLVDLAHLEPTFPGQRAYVMAPGGFGLGEALSSHRVLTVALG